ncbi:DUF2334 domain-containing protein [Brevibacillus daliensis]|uniref:DUF2334 domain-containing protein n=1 Tax=Brevibacillus daliensis TaxID=2892995 RepID=UPI001E2FC2A7|nr:DUF2334 domain-containing protein [Brevibacillus daliensis]
MNAKYIFRIDDVAPNMEWENYNRLKHIFQKHNVKPLLGVIPDNQDEELKKWPICTFDFWEEIRSVQQQGWEIAIHGYQHKFLTNDAGILGIHPRSEFAGLPFEQQYSKLKQAKEIFLEHGIQSSTFMAPAHTFDQDTLKALHLLGIHTITDGYGFFPYLYSQIMFVPQLFAFPRKMPFGVFTFCLHPNLMSVSDIIYIEQFILANQRDIIPFVTAKTYLTNNPLYFWMGKGAGFVLQLARRLRM